MAKPNKLDDYWKQHNVESIFKQLTHHLAEKMPDDPILAVVQYLQKKHPKSFRTSIDEQTRQSSTSRDISANLSRKIFEANRSAKGIELSEASTPSRRSSINQASSRPMIPSGASAFSDIQQRNSSVAENFDRSIVLQNIANADRLGQFAVKLAKDVRSKRDILDDEFIKPIPSKSEKHFKTDAQKMTSTNKDSILDEHVVPTSQQQLIRYKQHIHQENERRAHREKLAAMANEMNERDNLLQSDSHRQSIESGQGMQETKNITNKSKKMAPAEAEIVNDELNFGSSMRRFREPKKTKNFGFLGQMIQFDRGTNLLGSMTTGSEALQNSGTINKKQCEKCGAFVYFDETGSNTIVEPKETTRDGKVSETEYSEQEDNEPIDDWFDNDPISINPEKKIYRESPKVNTSTNGNVFQPIEVNDPTTITHRPPVVPTISVSEHNNSMRLRTPRQSTATDVFVRTPDPTSRRSSTNRTVGASPTNSTPRSTPRRFSPSNNQFSNAFEQLLSHDDAQQDPFDD